MKKLLLLFPMILVVAYLGMGAQSCSEMADDQTKSDNVSQVWSQVHTGMSQNEVRSLLGEPDDTEAEADAEPDDADVDLEAEIDIPDTDLETIEDEA